MQGHSCGVLRAGVTAGWVGVGVEVRGDLPLICMWPTGSRPQCTMHPLSSSQYMYLMYLYMKYYTCITSGRRILNI